ncbi:hypothetical protein JW823_01235 [bacterium]|nr:hypothetical protein [candidate division CSSED10-310 bacterium]
MMNDKEESVRINSGRIAVIGVGDFGSDAMMRLVFRQNADPLRILMNWADCLPKRVADEVHVAMEPSYRGSTKGDPITAAKAVAEVIPQLVDLTLSANFVVLIAQPGDGVGSGATTALADAFQRYHVPFLSLLILPDADTVGRKRHMTARSTISELCVMKETPVIFDQIEFPGYFTAFKRSVLDKIQTLMDALSPGMIPIDFNRIRSALTGSAGTAIATARATGPTRAQEAAESVLADPTVECFLNRKASILLHLQSDEALSLYEVEEVAHLITENWGDDVDLIYGVDQGGWKQGELKLGLIVGDYVDDIGIEEYTKQPVSEQDAAISELFARLKTGSSL